MWTKSKKKKETDEVNDYPKILPKHVNNLGY
jgi:hypothetical protein